MDHTLAGLCEGETILIAVGTDPRFTQAKFKSPALVSQLAIQIARERLIDTLRGEMLEKLATRMDEFIVMNGERTEDESNDRDEWDSAADDLVASLLEPYSDVLSASWLGVRTVDTRMHVPGEIQTLAMQFAQEVWTQLTYRRTDNQILAGLGILEADINAMLASYVAVVPKEEVKMTQINAVLNKIMLAMPDDKTLEEDLDLASDTDDGLAVGAGQRLGITMPECLVLRKERNANSINEWAFAILTGEMLPVDDLEVPPILDRNLMPPPPPPKAKPQMPPPPPAKAPPLSEAAPPGTKGRKRVPAASAPPPSAIAQETLVKLKTYANIRDEDVATMFGVSRPTMNNYLRGKGHAVPTPVQRETLKAFVQKHLDALQEVLDEIG